jgi:hypothetical protein
MKGLLADVNVQGHLPWLERLIKSIDLWEILVGEGIRLATFADLGLDPGLDDRTLWQNCQQDGWVLFTNDKNNDGPDSLQATIDDLWEVGKLPVLTLSNQGRFVRDGVYAKRVAADIAELLVGIKSGDPLDRPRIFVPV